jgi:hypothetical protein
VQVREQSFSEPARAIARLHCIAQRHLLEGKKHAVTRTLLDSYGARRNLGMTFRLQQRAEFSDTQGLAPAQVRLPFVIPLRLDVVLVAKSTGVEAQELAPAT